MRTTKYLILSLFLSVALTVALGSQPEARAAAPTEIAIVVNSSNPINALSLSDLRKIYMGERVYWKTNSPVLLLMRSSGSRERDVILRVVYQMTEQQYTQYWVAKVMRAEASDPPAILYSLGMVLEGVKGSPGAIGYLDSRDVRPGMKVLRIDGFLPGEAGYPLR